MNTFGHQEQPGFGALPNADQAPHTPDVSQGIVGVSPEEAKVAVNGLLHGNVPAEARPVIDLSQVDQAAHGVPLRFDAPAEALPKPEQPFTPGVIGEDSLQAYQGLPPIPGQGPGKTER